MTDVARRAYIRLQHRRWWVRFRLRKMFEGRSANIVSGCSRYGQYKISIFTYIVLNTSLIIIVAITQALLSLGLDYAVWFV